MDKLRVLSFAFPDNSILDIDVHPSHDVPAGATSCTMCMAPPIALGNFCEGK